MIFEILRQCLAEASAVAGMSVGEASVGGMKIEQVRVEASLATNVAPGRERNQIGLIFQKATEIFALEGTILCS